MPDRSPKRLYPIYQVDAFTRSPFRGNPAGVVPDASGLSATDMQSIARELNNSETAFVLPADGPDHEVRLRFFTPTVEVPSCGHATIAAHYVRAVEGRHPGGEVSQKIGIGVLPVEVIKDGNDYRIAMRQATPTFGAPIPSQLHGPVMHALGLTEVELVEELPLQVADTGNAKLMVPVRSRAILDRLEPDLEALRRLSVSIGAPGYFVFTLDRPDPDVATHGRMFAPALGIAEDPVTGNGNGPLGAYLVRHEVLEPVDGVVRFFARQGEKMGRPGVVEVIVEGETSSPKRVTIVGEAVIVFRGEIAL